MHKHSHHISSENEKKTLVVIIFTVIAMIAEIAYGYITNSMALLADGYHMGTHAIALGLTYAAYVLTRKLANSDRFPKGTEKIGTIAAYTSSLFLGLTGLWIIVQAIGRFINPLKIHFNEAIVVAIIGLIVNAVCILVMERKHSHGHHHENHDNQDINNEENEKHNKDYNFIAAYYHILADALTSVFAIIALLFGKYFGIIYLDSLIGVLGGILILKWAYGLIKNTVKILINME